MFNNLILSVTIASTLAAFNSVMTMSLPPQTSALSVEVLK